MVLSGSFLIGGSDDRKGGRKARVRTMNFPNAVQVRGDGSRQRGSSHPDRGPHWKQPPGIRAAGPRHGPARLHDWLGRWQVFAPDYTFFCPKVLKPPPSCSLKHGSFWFVASGLVPLPLPSYFPPFPPSLSKKSFSLQHQAQAFQPPFKLLPNFSQTHLYSCHVFLPSFTAEIFIKLFFKPAGSFTSPFSFPSTASYIAKSSLPPCAEWTFKLEPRMFWESFVSACSEFRDSTRFANPVFSLIENIPDSDTVAEWGRDRWALFPAARQKSKPALPMCLLKFTFCPCVDCNAHSFRKGGISKKFL